MGPHAASGRAQRLGRRRVLALLLAPRPRARGLRGHGCTHPQKEVARPPSARDGLQSGAQRPHVGRPVPRQVPESRRARGRRGRHARDRRRHDRRPAVHRDRHGTAGRRGDVGIYDSLDRLHRDRAVLFQRESRLAARSVVHRMGRRLGAARPARGRSSHPENGAPILRHLLARRHHRDRLPGDGLLGGRSHFARCEEERECHLRGRPQHLSVYLIV
mmetsp:Transcript_4443/g.18057  ORF Transcript_4443/g.18057 Transcript_4443/m.18057 type:complete len:217 (-) Transcript_4443:1659-2309(-)